MFLSYMGLAWVFLPESLSLSLEDDISIAHFLKKVNRFEEKILKNRELLLGGRHLTFCVDIGVRLCYTIIVPKGTERRKKKMKEYTVEVEIRAWAKVSVVARNGEEAIEAACDMVDLDDVYDWEIEGAEVV